MNYLWKIATALQIASFTSLCNYCSAQKISVYKIDLTQTESARKGYSAYTCASQLHSQLPFTSLLVPHDASYLSEPMLKFSNGEHFRMHGGCNLEYDLYQTRYDAELRPMPGVDLSALKADFHSNYFLQVSLGNQLVLCEPNGQFGADKSDSIGRVKAIQFTELLDLNFSSLTELSNKNSATQNLLEHFDAFKACRIRHFNTLLMCAPALNQERNEWEYWLVVSTFSSEKPSTPLNCFAIRFDRSGFEWLDDTARKCFQQ